MTGCSFVGRVGGLAVALGIGAAAFSGSAVAWADAPSAGSDAPSAGSDAPSAGANGPSAGFSAAAGTGSPTARQTRGTASSGAVRRNSSRSASNRAGAGPLPSSAAVQSGAKPLPAIAEQPAGLASLLKNIPDLQNPPAATQFAPPSAVAELSNAVLEYPRRGTSAAKSAAAVSSAAATQPLILGPSGKPIPTQDYVTKVMSWYVEPNSPDVPNPPQVVFTPEGLYPITGVKSLPLNTSVDQGMKILSDTLGLLPDGTPTTVFGYSQSAIIGSLLQADYTPATYVPPDYTKPVIPDGLKDSINFVFVGNEMNPNGGFLSRFPDLDLPSLGIPFYGPTPENAYPTTNYTREYDGFADFPRYPLNFLSVLNAGLGIVFVHTQYVPGQKCTAFCLTQVEVEDAIALPSTSPTQKYFFMPTEDLPLLEPLRLIPLIGTPIADLIQPVLKVIVNLGYGDPAHGFTSATQPDANVVVPFGLFPEVSPLEVLGQLVAGVQQGLGDFVADFGPDGSIAREISSISLPPLSISLPTYDSPISAVQNVISAIAYRISAAAAGFYAALLPTADIINAIAISLPAYNINLVLSGIEQMLNGDPIGGLISAIGLPIAANVGLITTAGLVGALAWAQAIAAVIDPKLMIGT